MTEIIVDEQFKSLIPPLTDEERGQLLESLKKEGCRDPLVVWEEEGILIDGHNRYELCLSEAIGFDTVGRSFESRAAAEEWVIRNQFGRRNLTPAQRVELALRLEEAIREKAKVNFGKRTDLCQNSDEGYQPVDTKKELAKIAGVSHDTVAKVKRVLEYAEPETVGLLRSGEISVNEAHKRVKSREKAKRREEKASRKIGASLGLGSVAIHRCSVAELSEFVEASSVDCIITDPPYPREFLSVYGELSDFARYALKDGGSLVCMVGQSYLPEIIELLGRSLEYQWTLAYLTPGGQATQLWDRKVNTFWKPLLWFVKGEYTGDWLGDVCKSATNDNDKEHHYWGQSESGMIDIVKRFTDAGQLVCDPFLGGGTTAVVCADSGRRFIGCDIDEDALATTRERLGL